MAQKIHSVLKKALAVVPEELHPSELHLGAQQPRCPMRVLMEIALEGVALLAARDGADLVRDAMRETIDELRKPINASGMRPAEHRELDHERTSALSQDTDDVEGDSLSQRATRRLKRAAYNEARVKGDVVATSVARVTEMVASALYEDGHHERLKSYLATLDQRLMCAEAAKVLERPVARVLHRKAIGKAIGELVVELGPESAERYLARVKIKRRWQVLTAMTVKELLATLPDVDFSRIADSVLSRADR